MNATLPELRPHRGPYKGLESLLPKITKPSWVRLMATKKDVPSPPPANVAQAQMREKRARAKRSLARRGVKGFLAAIAAAPSPSSPR